MRKPFDSKRLKPPQLLSISECMLGAFKELVQPYPATHLLDYPLFDRITGGFRPREFTILCGSTGSGKTTLLANWSACLFRQEVMQLVMSVETGHLDFSKRLLSVLAGKDLNTGNPVDPQYLAELALKFEAKLAKQTAYLSLYDNRISVEQLIFDLEYLVTTQGVKIAFIDNLNFFLEVTRAADQNLEMDRVIHELIIFCKQVDIHLVMVMHPKKTTDTRVLSEFDIKGSSLAVQEAHNVFLFNRPDPAKIISGERLATDRELTIRKMRRRGQFVGHTIVFSNHNTVYREVTSYESH